MATPAAQVSALSLEQLTQKICDIPNDFHEAGVMGNGVLKAMARILSKMHIQHSAETGSGKTTLLFSHLSHHHTVFAKDQFDHFNVGSISAVQGSELFQQDRTEYVVGATQETLPHHHFEHPLDAVLIDGPHGFPFPELEYYFFYPHLREGGLLILDDIHIPTIRRLYEFLREDDMFELEEVCDYTAFFRRTSAPLFNPVGDGWWEQGFNVKHRKTAREDADRELLMLNEAAANEADEAATVRSVKSDGERNIKYYLFRVVAKVFGVDFALRVQRSWRAFRSAED